MEPQKKNEWMEASKHAEKNNTKESLMDSIDGEWKNTQFGLYF